MWEKQLDNWGAVELYIDLFVDDLYLSLENVYIMMCAPIMHP